MKLRSFSEVNMNTVQTFSMHVCTSRLLLVLSLVLGGCQSIPDISDWNKATKDVSTAVVEGFEASAAVNADLAKQLDVVLAKDAAFSDPSRRYGVVAAELKKRSEHYDQLFGAINDYSSSLAAIARAANNSSKTVDAVASS